MPAARSLIVAIGAVALSVYGSFYFGVVTVSVDTTTYWQWHPWVPLGYPIFLSAIDHIAGLRWAGSVQVAALVASMTFLGLAVERLTGRCLIGLFGTLLLLSYTPVFAIQAGLQSESLYIPLLLTNVGFALILVAGRSRSAAIGLAVSTALLIFVRPAGFFVLCGAAFLLIVYRRQWRWMAAWLVLPLILCLLTTSAINYLVRGSAAQSQFGRVLFPHVAFIYEPDGSCFGDAVDGVMQKRRAGYFTSANRAIFSMLDYNKRLDELDAALATNCSRENAASAYLNSSLTTIRTRPAAYLSLIADSMIEAWSPSTTMANWGGFNFLYKRDATEYVPLYRNRAKAFNLPLSEDAVTLTPERTAQLPGQIVDVADSVLLKIIDARWLIVFVGIASLIAIPLGMIWPRFAAIGYCGVLIHSAMLLVAGTTVFIPRYMLPIDLVLLIAGALLVQYAAHFARMTWLSVQFKATPVVRA